MKLPSRMGDSACSGSAMLDTILLAALLVVVIVASVTFGGTQMQWVFNCTAMAVNDQGCGKPMGVAVPGGGLGWETPGHP